MRGVRGLKSLSYWPQKSILSTTRIFCPLAFFFSGSVLDIWVYKQKISLESSMLLLSAPIHAGGLMCGPYVADLVLVGRWGSAGWKRYLLHNGTDYLSSSAEWRTCDIYGQAVPVMKHIQTHSSLWDQAVWVVYISPRVSFGSLPCVMSLSCLLWALLPLYSYSCVWNPNIVFCNGLIVVCSCFPIPEDLCNHLKGTL